MTDTPKLETKSAGPETVAAWETFCEGFEAFKDANDQRIAEIERRGSADALTTEKIAAKILSPGKEMKSDNTMLLKM